MSDPGSYDGRWAGSLNNSTSGINRHAMKIILSTATRDGTGWNGYHLRARGLTVPEVQVLSFRKRRLPVLPGWMDDNVVDRDLRGLI